MTIEEKKDSELVNTSNILARDENISQPKQEIDLPSDPEAKECFKIIEDQIKKFYNVFLKYNWKEVENKNGIKIVSYDAPEYNGIRAFLCETTIERPDQHVNFKK